MTGVARELRIHALTNISQVGQLGPFWENIETELITTVHSGANGFFEVELPPGRYSIFALEDTLLYCNTGDGQANLCPITVEEGEVTGIRFDIWYKAAF